MLLLVKGNSWARVRNSPRPMSWSIDQPNVVIHRPNLAHYQPHKGKLNIGKVHPTLEPNATGSFSDHFRSVWFVKIWGKMPRKKSKKRVKVKGEEKKMMKMETKNWFKINKLFFYITHQTRSTYFNFFYIKIK